MNQRTNKPVPVKQPKSWGTSTAAFYGRLEGEPLQVKLTTGEVLDGYLVGLDRYDIFIEQADGRAMLVSKNAIAWVRRAA